LIKSPLQHTRKALMANLAALTIAVFPSPLFYIMPDKVSNNGY